MYVCTGKQQVKHEWKKHLWGYSIVTPDETKTAKTFSPGLFTTKERLQHPDKYIALVCSGDRPALHLHWTGVIKSHAVISLHSPGRYIIKYITGDTYLVICSCRCSHSEGKSRALARMLTKHLQEQDKQETKWSWSIAWYINCPHYMSGLLFFGSIIILCFRLVTPEYTYCA